MHIIKYYVATTNSTYFTVIQCVSPDQTMHSKLQVKCLFLMNNREASDTESANIQMAETTRSDNQSNMQLLAI